MFYINKEVMENAGAKKYLLDIGFDDAHLPNLFNDDDKSYYTIPELMDGYLDMQCGKLSNDNVRLREILYNLIYSIDGEFVSEQLSDSAESAKEEMQLMELNKEKMT